ncbi:unnamed protein product [Acanthosepion pharaonis]|uniref:Uncharacterized protein n=1 Tax=Acanthosepion pharaonis TaxID=158019 RepID=A0A812CXV9_ACAPH|nr:unnamed protein product [Sepia pharaonis]
MYIHIPLFLPKSFNHFLKTVGLLSFCLRNIFILSLSLSLSLSALCLFFTFFFFLIFSFNDSLFLFVFFYFLSLLLSLSFTLVLYLSLSFCHSLSYSLLFLSQNYTLSLFCCFYHSVCFPQFFSIHWNRPPISLSPSLHPCSHDFPLSHFYIISMIIFIQHFILSLWLYLTLLLSPIIIFVFLCLST